MKAKKSLGQNFLKSPAVVRKMVEVANLGVGPLNTDVVLEIGPGKGALTQYLLEAGTKVVAVEKDADMMPILREKFAEQLKAEKLTLIHGDISQKETLKSIWYPGTIYKVIANIPYYITGEILRTFLETEHQPKSITVMVQKEVAQRIVARDGKESILSMSVKAYGEPKYVQKVPAMLFSPAPKVDSAVLHIANISKGFFKEYNITEEQFFTVLKQGFAQKRKKLTNNLNKLLNKPSNKAKTAKPCFAVSSLLEQLGIEPNARAETLTLEQWGQLTKLLNK